MVRPRLPHGVSNTFLTTHAGIVENTTMNLALKDAERLDSIASCIVLILAV
jgi:hypothetical protein